MVDSKAVVILMTLMTYQDLSLYELSVKTKFTIREIKDRIDELNDFWLSMSSQSCRQQDLAIGSVSSLRLSQIICLR